ncbi:MAG: GDP-mannose 4,6-dehydratase [Thermoplasmatales archaeon]|nr:GDP-mannose 4,6-dehydratase [Thermoplasmatales archaeon]
MGLKNGSVLVTGGAGFIGSYLVDRLVREEPDNLVVVDNFFLGKESNLEEAKKNYPNLKVYNQDASDYEKMKEIMENENVEVVFNLAVIPLSASLTKPGWVFEQNVNITLSICELARNDFFDTLIHFSSSEAYGTSEYAPMDEKHPLNGTTPYAASKAASDQLIFSYCRTFGIDASIIRPFNNYGPRQNEGSYAGVIPLTIKRILNDEAPVIYGDGEQTRDYLYAIDTVNAAIDVYNVKSTRGRVLNIASGKEMSIETVVKLIAKYLNCDKPIVYEKERPGDVRRHIANIYLAEDLIGFTLTIKFEEGLKRTIGWYKEKLIKDELR